MTPLFAIAALGLSACGGGDKGSPAKKTGEAATALKELAATRDGLKTARETYRSGDKGTAGRQAGDAYLEHFEKVEGPLEARDEKLTVKLEDGIRQELRDEIKSAGKAEVEQRFRSIFADLDKAEAALR